MNAPSPPLLLEVHLGGENDGQQALQLASEGVLRYVWHGAFGEMLIEVQDGVAFVNGARVTSIAELRKAGSGEPP